MTWTPPEKLDEAALRALSDKVLAEPDIEIERTEDISRIEAAGLEWDIGTIVYAPKDMSRIPTGPDGRKVGIFLMHGGDTDYHFHEEMAKLVARKCGYHVISMTFPGRFYFDHPDHHWPGDTINPDGTARMPIWKRGEVIGPDQYDMVEEGKLKKTYGTFQLARAKPGTMFYDRMAAWPLAFETAMLSLCRRFFPASEYSVYVHGHSTGGPFSHMLLQRLENAVGIVGIENSPFGNIWQRVNGNEWQSPFTDLVLRTWRDVARYKGAEALRKVGPQALMSLPALIEDIYAAWDQMKTLPEFKAEYVVHLNCKPELEASAKAVAKRLNYGPAETQALVDRYLGYPKAMEGPGVKPVPPIIYIICAFTRDHTPDNYFNIILPGLAEINPPPKVKVIQFGLGAHKYSAPQDGLPYGLAPAALSMWRDAINGGYYLG
jgi:hypothetical protein